MIATSSRSNFEHLKPPMEAFVGEQSHSFRKPTIPQLTQITTSR